MAANSGKGGLRHLDTDAMYEAVKDYETAVDKYEEEVNSMERIVDKLLGTWEGEGKRAFVKDYELFAMQLKDLMDVLMNLRTSLIDAETAFLNADADVSKEMACALTK